MRGPALLAALGLVVGCGESPAPSPQVVGAAPVVQFAVAADWPSYNRDLAGTRHSQLKQIDADNVGDLRQAWTYDLGINPAAGSASLDWELTPLVVAGVLYAAAADRVMALRADTGEEVWRYSLEQDSPSRHGVTYWPGEGIEPGRVFFTAGRRLIALEASSGRKMVTFGREGEVALPTAYDAAPTRFENLLIVGSHGAPGGVRAFDARSGAQVWEFLAEPEVATGGVPQPLLHRPFAFTIDIDRALLYAVLDRGGREDYYGGEPAHDRALADAIVALDARSGAQRWHFQTVHHDIWNFDLLAAPSLLDVTIGGAIVPMLVQSAKNGYVYLLNRVTGEPVFRIVEAPMPQSDVPGELTSPTQPIPVRPAPVARVSFVADDLVAATDTSAAHATLCRDLLARSGGLRNLGPFTPYRYRERDAEPRSSAVFPGDGGGVGWGGTAADPDLGLIFVNSTSEGSVGWIERNAADVTAAQTGEGPRLEQLPYRRVSAAQAPFARFAAAFGGSAEPGSEPAGDAAAMPCQRPPWGELVAVRAATGDIEWRVPLGISAQLPEERQRTGRRNFGGPISTAGGLVFIGASDDRRFRAFDSRTGEELWATELPSSAHAVPVTYLARDGKQYVVIVAAGGAADNSSGAHVIIAYALP